KVVSSNFMFELLSAGHSIEHIWSVPSGHAVEIDPSRRYLKLWPHQTLPAAGPANARESAAAFRQKMASTFERLYTLRERTPVFVTLSGGLDSTTVAVHAKATFGEVVGVTFALDSDAGQPGSDLASAQAVAKALKMELIVIRPHPDDVVALLDRVLRFGQDWRDFNVHCGLVNAAVASGLRRQLDDVDARPLVLTGDTMNELVADYTPVKFGDQEYYKLPRLPLPPLRDFLIRGLDTGDREVGVFASYGIDTIQPYALCADVLGRLPETLLGFGDAKQTLYKEAFGDRIPSHVYNRPKVRAQVGAADVPGGTLGLLVGRGIDAKALAQRFCDLHGLQSVDLMRWIRAGRYRFTSSYPQEEAS
ncbi:MAG: asparagine synthase-related protein, partial [Myxococcota bacterium]